MAGEAPSTWTEKTELTCPVIENPLNSIVTQETREELRQFQIQSDSDIFSITILKAWQVEVSSSIGKPSIGNVINEAVKNLRENNIDEYFLLSGPVGEITISINDDEYQVANFFLRESSEWIEGYKDFRKRYSKAVRDNGNGVSWFKNITSELENRYLQIQRDNIEESLRDKIPLGQFLEENWLPESTIEILIELGEMYGKIFQMSKKKLYWKI